MAVYFIADMHVKTTKTKRNKTHKFIFSIGETQIIHRHPNDPSSSLFEIIITAI